MAEKPRILIPEKISPDGVALLSAEFEVDVRQKLLTAEELLEAIPGYEGLIVRSETKVTKAVLDAGARLRVVARAGVGTDNIAVEAATANGIVVVNSPTGNIKAASEHTVALLLATARHVGRADRSVKAGRWERAGLVGVEVGGKTLGVVGLGKVGAGVARACGPGGLGMRVLAYDPYAGAELAAHAGAELVPSLAALLPAADFLTVHTPLLASTLDLVGEAELRAMKPSARVLNVARGGVYNEAALLRALDEGWIAGAGLDVFTEEPLPAGVEEGSGSVAARLARHEKVVATPHLGASTVEAQENVSRDVCAQVRRVLGGGLPTSAVNAPLILPEVYRKLQPFVALVEKMGALYTQHFVGSSSRGGGGGGGHHTPIIGGRRFDLVYQGDLASVPDTAPLFASLVKGLVSSISDSRGRDVNMVNAALIAREKGISVNEVRSREAKDPAPYASLVTLRTSGGGGGDNSNSNSNSNNDKGGVDHGDDAPQVIEGYVSGGSAYISRLGRFHGSFAPSGDMLILHNYDEPGKIGGVGMALSRYRINITFMQVASLDPGGPRKSSRADSAVAGLPAPAPGSVGGVSGEKNSQVAVDDNEALMIVGVDGRVTKEVLDDLKSAEGILDVSLVRL